MNVIVKNILLATFILSIFWECSETHNFNRNISGKYDNRTDVVRLRRQSPVHSCKGDVLKFQCATTTDCISAELECDGKEDCPDGSDEKESLCKDFPKKCRTPGKPAHGQWINLINAKNDYFSSQIDENSVLKYSCNQGYKLSTTAEYSVLVHCLPNGQWNLPVLPVCQKLCESLYNSPLITVSCKNNGSPVRCDRATDNTIVTYKCAPHYEVPYGRAKSSTCYEGFWDYIPECTPVCGEKRVSATTLIVNGHEVERGHYPWAVALYSRRSSDPYFTNICGGSLLTTNIVLTAAHCVSQKETGNVYNAKYFRVGAGKYYNQYEDSRDADTAQYAEVALIEAYREYKGEIQNFRADIALLKLKTNLVLSEVVQPVCYNNLPIIEPNTVGLVTGWGYTISSGEPSETLKELELPYNADEQCLKDLDKDFSNRYFTPDKLCAGFNDQNTSVCNGDSGGGLVFRNPSFKRRYFIHGIVSLAHSYKENQRTHCNIQRNALFTKVENYIEWIQLKVRHWTSITNNAKKCRAPAQPENGRWAYLNNGSKDGSNQEIDTNTAIIFSCNEGYQLSDTNEDSLTMLCMSTGKWSVTVMPVCQRSACQHLGIPGICQKIKDCPLAIEAIKIRGKHGLKPCGFQGQDQIVCCAGLPVTVDSAPPSSDNTQIEMKPERNNDNDPNRAPPCDPSLCLLPDCFCSENGTSIPGDLPAKDVPQMITITFDDAINSNNIKLYKDIFNGKRKNPNGCDIKTTFFISHKFTNYSAVQEMHRKGHEIAVHSITHKDDERFWSNASVDDWAKEMGGMRIITEKYANITDNSVVGVRAPYLRVGGNNQFTMMEEQAFLYDSTITAPLNNPPLWPYAMYFRIPHRCHGNVQNCPTRSHAVWEMVLNELDRREDPTKDEYLPGCGKIDSCSNILTSDQFYNFLNHNFDRHYEKNRAPLGLHFHAAWFKNTPEFLDAFLYWVDEILSNHNDVYFVTMAQVIQWIQHPRTVTKAKNFEPWREKCVVEGPPACWVPHTCKLTSKEVPGETINLQTCVRCPKNYPWIIDPTGDGLF